jgi:branched-chain amino acid transport system permease protein
MNRSLDRRLLAAGLLISVVLPWLLPNFYIFLLTKILFLSLASASLILLAGYGGMLSLAQIAFFGVAGYIVGYCGLRTGIGFTPAVFLAVLGSAVTGALFALLAIRTSGLYFLMMTLALGQLAFFGAFQWAEVTGGYDGLVGIPAPVLFGYAIESGKAVYYFTLVPAAAGFFWLGRLVASPFGLAMQGIRDSEIRMAALGYNVKIHKFLAIVFSSAVAGTAGVLSTHFYGMISPQMVSLWAAVTLLFISLLGGMGRFEGAFIGALVYVLFDDYASVFTDRHNTVIGVFFVLIVLFFPKGIAEIFRWRKTTKGRQQHERNAGVAAKT